MDTNKLSYFVTIADTGSMRKAAEILHISPAALSKATKLLEEDLELKLIIQDGRNIAITDEGKKLVEQSRPLIQQLSQLKENLHKDINQHKQVSIATFEVFSTYFLTFLNYLKWDNIPLKLYEVNPGELENSILNYHADIGITYLPIPHPELDFLKIMTVEMGVFKRKGSFTETNDQSDHPFVVPVMPLQGSPTRVRGLDGWPEHGYERIIKYEVTLMESALELCRQGRCVGFFPKFIINEHNKRVLPENQLVKLPPSKKLKKCTTDIFIVKRKGYQENKTIKQIAKAIRNICS